MESLIIAVLIIFLVYRAVTGKGICWGRVHSSGQEEIKDIKNVDNFKKINNDENK